MINMNSSEFHVLTVEHGRVVGYREGGDSDGFMCEQLGLLFVLTEGGAYFGEGGRKTISYKNIVW